jgi:hypothetical protein
MPKNDTRVIPEELKKYIHEYVGPITRHDWKTNLKIEVYIIKSLIDEINTDEHYKKLIPYNNFIRKYFSYLEDKKSEKRIGHRNYSLMFYITHACIGWFIKDHLYLDINDPEIDNDCENYEYFSYNYLMSLDDVNSYSLPEEGNYNDE